MGIIGNPTVCYAGGAAIGLLFGWFLTWDYYRAKLRGRHRRQKQDSGPDSANVQAGRDATSVDLFHPPYGS